MRKDTLNKFVFQPGLLVSSKAGRDKDKLYVVTGMCGEQLLLSDGTGRTANNPKRKNIKHVQRISLTVWQCVGYSRHPEVPDDAEIREAIKYYAMKRQNQEEE